MVPIYKFRYEGETTKDFINQMIYIGRRSKAGDLFVRCERGYWFMIFSWGYTVNPHFKYFNLIDKTYVKNHKEAINYEEVKIDKTYWAGCNYWFNQGDEYGEIGTATSMHDCTDCREINHCDLKKESEVWKI